MSISAGLEWVGNLGPGAEAAATSVDRLTASLRALQGVQGGLGKGASVNGGIAGPGGIGAMANAANRAATIQTKSAAEIAKIEAQARANTQAESQRQESARLKAIQDVIKGQAKTADDVYLTQAKSAEASKRAAEKAALTEQQGALRSAQIREKSAADIARIQAKSAADIAKEDAKAKNRAVERAAKQAEKASKAAVTEETTSGLGGAAKAILEGKGIKGALGAFGGKGAVVAAVGEVALDVASRVADLSLTFGKAVVGAQAYREDLSEAFTVVAGSAAKGDAIMQRALATADRLGAGRAETVGQFLDLTTKGFEAAEIERITGSLRDLTTIDPSASIEGLTKVIGKVKATGRLNQETLNELSTFGLEQSDVLAEIGKIIGKNDKEVLKQLSSAGGIRGLGVEPILRAINKQVGGGPAGQKAAEKSERNLSALIRRVEELPGNILFDVQAGPGLDNIKTILRDVLQFFKSGTDTGDRTRKVVGDLFNALSEGLFGRRASDKEGITGTLESLLELAERSVPVVREAAQVAGSLGRAFLAIASGNTSGLDEQTKKIVGIINLVKEVLKLLAPRELGGTFGPGGLIQPILDILGIDADASAVRKVVDDIANIFNPRTIFNTIKAALTGGDVGAENPLFAWIGEIGASAGTQARSAFASVGTFLIDGLVGGIAGGAQRVVDAVKGVASGALNAAVSVLKIGSPSKETQQIGGWFDEGMEIGIDRQAATVANAARVMAEDAALAASMAVPSLSSGALATGAGSSARGPIIVQFQGPLVVIEAGADVDLDAAEERLEPVIRRVLTKVCRDIAAEGGF